MITGAGKHTFPSRTRSLRPQPPMVVPPRWGARVGCRRVYAPDFPKGNQGLFCVRPGRRMMTAAYVRLKEAKGHKKAARPGRSSLAGILISGDRVRSHLCRRSRHFRCNRRSVVRWHHGSVPCVCAHDHDARYHRGFRRMILHYRDCCSSWFFRSRQIHRRVL